MKILMVLVEGTSGQFQQAVLLANALAKTNQVTAILPLEAEKRLFDDSVKLIPLAVADTKKNFIINTINATSLFKFLRSIYREDPDVLHFHNPYDIWTCFFLPWLRRYPKVVSLPDGALLASQGQKRRLDMVISRKMHIESSDCLIVLYEYDRERLGDYARKKKVFIIPHGENIIFKEYGRDDIVETNSALFFGSISDRKGLEYLLKAVPLIQQKVPDFKLMIAGSGKMEQYARLMEGLQNIEVDNRFIPHQEVAPYFRRASMVVLPYTDKVFPGVIPVAYSFSKPVVVSDMVSELVDGGKTGLIVPPRDEKALAEAMIELLHNEELRREMGKNALQKARQELSWDELARKTVQVYQAALRGEHQK